MCGRKTSAPLKRGDAEKARKRAGGGPRERVDDEEDDADDG